MNNEKINIFIPAAGQGERLRPITNHIPKPLMPLLGKTALQRVIECVSALPFKKIGVNAYYMKEKVDKWVLQSPYTDDVVLFKEDDVIGTGGALKNAESLLGTMPFLVHNSDVISDIDLGKLLEHHRSSGNLVTLAVHDYPEFNSLVLDENGCLKEISKGEPGSMAFTGIAVYEQYFLEFLPQGNSSVVDGWLKAAGAGPKVGAYDVTGAYWTDIGTPASYAKAVFRMLKEEGETVFVHNSIKECGEIEIEGQVVIESGTDIRGIASLKNCILLPGCSAGAFAYSRHENYIMGPKFRVLLEEADMFGIDEEGKQLIGTGGSDREYFRIQGSEGPKVLMQCREGDTEYERHLEYTRFFIGQGVPVPELQSAEPEKMSAEFEDAGDISLYSWLKCPRPLESIEKVFRKVIDAVVSMHSIKESTLDDCPLLQSRIFDREYFRWETGYFIERFVEGLWNIDIEDVAGLEKDLDALAMKADSYPKSVIHRDLQSQNIMIVKDGVRLIDFQGARIGPPAYDMASLLWDPYCRLEESLRNSLVKYYEERMRSSSDGFDEWIFRESLLVCRLQRHMQALGAYGFLSKEKGKKHFLKHVPEGVRLLKEDVELCGANYLQLKKLIDKL